MTDNGAGALAPEGTRLIIASENLLDFIGTRTSEGRLLSYEWGEPDEHGWYAPTITATDDGSRFLSREAAERQQAIEEAARAVVKYEGFNEPVAALRAALEPVR